VHPGKEGWTHKSSSISQREGFDVELETSGAEEEIGAFPAELGLAVVVSNANERGRDRWALVCKRWLLLRPGVVCDGDWWRSVWKARLARLQDAQVSMEQARR
jgi:hypothetical protein